VRSQIASRRLGRQILHAVMSQIWRPFPYEDAERAQIALPVMVDVFGQWLALLHQALS